MIRYIFWFLLLFVLMSGFFLIYEWKIATYSLPAQTKKSRTIALTPPMGWNGWNHFRCSPELNENSFKEMVDALIKTGMRDAGYQYVNLDDCWQVARNADGTILIDQDRFPGGIKALAEYVHARGMKFGIYTSGGRLTCEKRPGSYGYEEQDVKTYAEWGVDYIKVDWCGIEYLDPATQYQVWRNAIDAVGRPMVLSIAIANIDFIPNSDAWIWGPPIAEMWRTAIDVVDYWPDFLRVFDRNTQYSDYQYPGAWNDADMMQVGNLNATKEEYRTHFSLWALMGSPLIAGHDVRTMKEDMQQILTNREVIAVDQDPLGAGAYLIKQGVGWQVWAKQLHKKGERAVVLLNRSDQHQQIGFSPKDVGLLPLYMARDLWLGIDFGWQNREITRSVLPHQVVMLKVKGWDELGWHGFAQAKKIPDLSLQPTTNPIPTPTSTIQPTDELP